MTSQTGTTDLRQRLSRLLLVYLSALAVLFVSVAGSVILSEMHAAQIVQDAEKINLSGRQRMLSQRIIYLAKEHQEASADDRARTAAALGASIDAFEAAVDLFETSHSALSTDPNLDAEIHALFFAGPADETLDARVRAYIANARAVLADPRDNASLARLKEIENAGLLRDLDEVVSVFEGASVSRVSTLRWFEIGSLALALLIILIEITFVFLPGHKLLKQNVAELEARNSRLAKARDDLEITSRALASRNQALAESETMLRNALEESERMRREQAEFTYAVSHDLKSPANTIGLLLQELDLIEDTREDPDARALIGHARGAVDRMGRLIADVLQYSWATHHRADPEQVDLNICLAEVKADLGAEIAESDALVRIGPTTSIFAYRMQLRILIQNLLSNALKFRTEGVRPEVTISCTPRGGGDGHLLCVSDNGIGISDENQQRVFGLFQRLHVREEYPGSGLGLATCQRVAANHSGSISLRSTPGKGTTFEVILRGPVEQSSWSTQQLDTAPQINTGQQEAAA